MKIALSTRAWDTTKADIVAVAIPSAKTKYTKAIGRLEAVTGRASIKPLTKDERFAGKAAQTLKVAVSGVEARWVLLVGVGTETEPTKIAYALGHALASSARAQKTGAVELPDVDATTVRAAAQGLETGAYRYVEYKSDKSSTSSLVSVEILGAPKSTRGLAAAIAAGRGLAQSVNFARDLVNRPPNDLNPVTLARAAAAESKKLGLTCSVWNKARIKKEGMNLLLAVNAGSGVEPRVIHVTYKPRNAKKKIAFVGKGLTFDAGGLCIKPAGSMITMKCDMAGAATTLGIVFAAARLKLPIEIHAVVGSTENMTGADAYRPGDVYESLQGKTVEVINTDAEGRLVLADVLTWTARKLKPDLMIDHATLTGAAMVALGQWRAALYTDHDDLAKRYLTASEQEGEAFWRMPLDGDLKATLKSPIADLKHVGGRLGGSITAALFLEEFIEGTKWMHLDIAGPSFLERAHGQMPQGGTGFGVATGVRFLESLA
ncbi:MAG: leucyl aminopeptidase [Polyangiales bacterium]